MVGTICLPWQENLTNFPPLSRYEVTRITSDMLVILF